MHFMVYVYILYGRHFNNLFYICVKWSKFVLYGLKLHCMFYLCITCSVFVLHDLYLNYMVYIVITWSTFVLHDLFFYYTVNICITLPTIKKNQSYNRRNIGEIDNPITHIPDCSIYWIGIGTSMKKGELS